ncbi:hypothetical protein CRM22_001757 [Opisthorchis felineus]|uniref:WW domain-containing protein n=1 Tax=Opisthorchis felineus TaxID=147828 RepID=A0A4S2MDG3_OPIFE|nr:hypothetical protein CRM22_001757 [Opisthorchis felineus]TGZ72989.1 hypothetical protein CRM22_001757 [Opisthorchis felineus]TGZ72991.1 hypothetical protein CRM22_001757 [Opisthorchis felineus]
MDQLDLPPGWERVYHPGVGNYYYVDHNTKTTTWKDPRGTTNPNHRPNPTNERLRYPGNYMMSQQPSNPYPVPPIHDPYVQYVQDPFPPYFEMPPYPTYRPHAPMPGFGFGTSMYQPTSRPPSFGTGSLPRNIPIQVVKHEVTRSPTPRRAAQSPEADRSSCSTPPCEATFVGRSKQSGSMSGDVIRNRHTLNVAGRRQQPSDKEATQYLHHSEEPPTGKVFYGSDGNEQVGCDAGPDEDSERERDNSAIKLSQEDDNERCSSLKTVPSFEPIPLPYYSLPTQLPTVSVEELKQSTKDPTEAPTNSAADNPQPPPVTSYDLISKALDELEVLKPEVDAFASPDKDKQYIYLEDRLDKLVSKIDQIEADGDEAVRNKRREAIKQVLGTITLLEQKLASAKSLSNKDSCKSDTQAEPDSTTLSDPETTTVPITTEPSV